MAAAISCSLAVVGVSFFGGEAQKTVATNSYTQTFNSANQLWNGFVAEQTDGTQYGSSSLGTKTISGHDDIKEAAVEYDASSYGTTTYSSSIFLLGSKSGNAKVNGKYCAKIGGVAGFNGLASISGTVSLDGGYSCGGGQLITYGANWNIVDSITFNDFYNKTNFTFSWKRTFGSSMWFSFYVVAANSTTQASGQNVLTLSSLTVNWSC
mgnify:CR=1 FL=1